MRLLGKTVELVRFPDESHDLSRAGRPDRRVERLRRITGWFERFLGTAATDRVVEQETQVLPTMTPTKAMIEVAPVVEPQPAETAAVAESDVAETMVLQRRGAAEAEIAEPEALPKLPEPGSEREVAPEHEATPELLIATAEAETEPEIEPAAEATVPEPDHEPHLEVEPVAAMAESEPQATPELQPRRPARAAPPPSAPE